MRAEWDEGAMKKLMADAEREAVRLGKAEVRIRATRMRCDEHGAPPRLIEQPDGFKIEGCCDDFVAKVQRETVAGV